MRRCCSSWRSRWSFWAESSRIWRAAVKLTGPGEADNYGLKVLRLQPCNDCSQASKSFLHGLFDRDKQMLEQREQQLRLQQQRLDTSKHRWDELAKILSKVRGRVEQLTDKLQNNPPVTMTVKCLWVELGMTSPGSWFFYLSFFLVLIPFLIPFS